MSFAPSWPPSDRADSSEGTLRAFFAVELPEAVRAELVRVSTALRDELVGRIRWVPEANLHLTLKFLGTLPERSLPELLARAAARLAREEPFSVSLAGAGAFPNARAARVLWIGVSEGAGELARLARKLDAAGRGVGAPRERRPYRAHLTLARLREPLRVPLERVPALSACGFCVEEIVLYESRLSSSGASHSPLARLPLGADEGIAEDLALEP